MPVAFQVEGLCKRYPGYALVIPRLQIPTGVVGLVGESGAGKSSLLNLLAGLDVRYEGRIRFHGAPLDEREGLVELRRRSFSFLFQQSNLLANFPVGANVELSRSLSARNGRPRVPVEEVLGPLFGEVPPRDLVARYPSDLSGGERQRVAVARALLKAHDGAQALFADEPTANIDRRCADVCFEQLCGWQGRRAEQLLFCATHDPAIARRTDSILLLGLVTDDERQTLLDEFEQQHGFGGGRPADRDKVFTVLASGPTEQTWPAIQERLLRRRDEPPSPGTEKGTPATASALSTTSDAPAPETTDEAVPAAAGAARPSLGQSLRFLLAFLWRDTTRRRELLDSAARVFVVFFLFLWIGLSASLYYGVPRVAGEVFDRDPLLRLVELESVGTFPISPEKMQRLESLVANAEGAVSMAGDPDEPPSPVEGVALARTSSPAGRALVAGCLPNRGVSFKFYRADGELNPRWTDGGRLVYTDRPDGDPLFEFWNLSPLAPDGGMLITRSLLEDLGFDAPTFRAWVEAGDRRAVLSADEFFPAPMPVARVVDELPDPHVDLLIPHALARKVKSGEMREAVYRSVSFVGYASMAEARADEPKLRAVLDQHAQPFRTFVEPSQRHRPGQPDFRLRVQVDGEEGLHARQWEEVQDLYATATADSDGVHEMVPGQKLFDRDVQPRPFEAFESNRATLFVHDWADVPRVLDHLEEHRRELKLKVGNRENKERIRTVERSYGLGVVVILVVSVVFLIVSTVCLAYSFVPQLQRKLGEVGILRAYGVSLRLVLARFVLEILLTCLAGLAVGSLLYGLGVLPWLNHWASELASDLFGGGGPLRFEPQAWIASALAVCSTVLVVGLVAYFRVRRSPAELLRMSE